MEKHSELASLDDRAPEFCSLSGREFYPCRGKVMISSKPGPYIAVGAEGTAAPARKTHFFSHVVFAELFLVAILVRNHKKMDLLTG